MTKNKWLAQAREHKEKLTDLIGVYHPAMYRGSERSKNVTISARDAEAACGLIREKIRDETEESPVGAFKDALAAGDIDKINSLLSAAWFGVPESPSCWRINGFKEAVDLMEDPPEEDEDESEQETQQRA
jgi:hypothetical protein